MKQHLLALLIAAATTGLTFLLLYGLLTAIRLGQVALCWPIYWLFLFLLGTLYVCVHQSVETIRLLRKNGYQP